MKRSPLSAIGSPVCSRACTARAVLQVVAAVEEEFGIEVRDEDLTPELIESVQTLVCYVDRVNSSSISSLSGMPS